MSPLKRRILILLSLLSVIVAPMIGALIVFKGSLPADFFVFPPLSDSPKPGFSWPIFIGLLVAILFFVVLYINPWLFGFKRVANPTNAAPNRKWAYWFWIGLIVSVVDGIVLFAHINTAVFIMNLGYIPIIWGFLLMTDAWVLKRTGHSLLKDNPKNILFMALCSAFAWGFFEYLSLFIDLNWYYPEGNRISTLAFYVYAIVGGGVLVPFAFEGYMLLHSFNSLALRYSKGPRMHLSRSAQLIILVVCLLSLFGISFYPYVLFPMLWLGPVVILSIVFDMIGLWTPFRPIVQSGNWTYLALIGLSEIIIGFIHEGVNYLSASHNPFETIVPGYWVYSIPYVDKFHIFEMPFEGLFGYLPYGIYNWIAWIGFAYLFKITTSFDKE